MRVTFPRDLQSAGRTCRPARFLLTGLLLALLAGSSVPALAVDKFAAEFLKIGVGARPMGMGGSFVSLVDDATATYWNPAGLTQLEHKEAMGMHASQFGGVVVHDVLGIVAPLKSPDHRSAVGLTLIRLGVDDIRVTTDKDGTVRITCGLSARERNSKNARVISKMFLDAAVASEQITRSSYLYDQTLRFTNG